jgi:hypothetical protein
MTNDYKLNDDEFTELKKLSSKSDLLAKVFNIIDLINANPALDSYAAVKKTHEKICNELLDKDVKLFNSDTESLKVFENYLKFQSQIESVVNTMNNLKKQLLPEEEVVANKKIKNSAQGFLNKAPINGSTN